MSPPQMAGEPVTRGRVQFSKPTQAGLEHVPNWVGTLAFLGNDGATMSCINQQWTLK